FGMDEIGAAIGKGIGLKLRGDIHCQPLALAGLAIPGLTLWVDPGAYPHRELAHMTAALRPLIFAGSASGPMITKSLYMTRRRDVPFPSAIQAFSAAGE